MSLGSYFDENKGIGVLSTANKEGKVNAALYARPHFMEDDSIAFIMRDKLAHANLKENPYAHYLFKEDGDGYKGKRLHLKKLKESDDQDTIDFIRRKSFHATISKTGDQEKTFLVYFQIEKELPLIGG